MSPRMRFFAQPVSTVARATPMRIRTMRTSVTTIRARSRVARRSTASIVATRGPLGLLAVLTHERQEAVEIERLFQERGRVNVLRAGGIERRQDDHGQVRDGRIRLHPLAE